MSLEGGWTPLPKRSDPPLRTASVAVELRGASVPTMTDGKPFLPSLCSRVLPNCQGGDYPPASDLWKAKGILPNREGIPPSPPLRKRTERVLLAPFSPLPHFPHPYPFSGSQIVSLRHCRTIWDPLSPKVGDFKGVCDAPPLPRTYGLARPQGGRVPLGA